MFTQDRFNETLESIRSAHYERAAHTYSLFEALYRPYILTYRQKYMMDTKEEGCNE